MEVTLLTIARRYLGLREAPGTVHNHCIMAMLRLDANWPVADEVHWCSAFVNWVCFQLGIKRSYNLSARSWLLVGEIISGDPKPGWDIVILKRGKGPQPGPEVIRAPGHVGFYLDSKEAYGVSYVKILGGNQGDMVSEAWFPASDILGKRRLGELE